MYQRVCPAVQSFPPGGAYFYLQKYAGLAFLIEYYDVEHLQSIDETLDDLVVMCRKNGGQLT